MTNDNRTDISWKSLYTVGGVAGLIAGVLFRRNLAVEVSMFSKVSAPAAVSEWFELLQNNRLLGLTYLHVFDLVNYALVGLMFLALYTVLNRVNRSSAAIAAGCALLGIAVYFSTNTSFSMLSLSDQYAAATTEAQRSLLLSAGQSMLALNRFSSSGAHPGTGGLVSLLLMATAIMIASFIMMRSNVFTRLTAYVGIVAGVLDLAYCLAYVFLTRTDGHILALLFIPAAGLLLMIWHTMVGWKLCQLARFEEKLKPAQQ